MVDPYLNPPKDPVKNIWFNLQPHRFLVAIYVGIEMHRKHLGQNFPKTINLHEKYFLTLMTHEP